MTAPAKPVPTTMRHKLRALTLECSGVVPPGRVMLCRGRDIVGYVDVDALAEHPFTICERANTLALAAADYDDVKRWLA